MVVKFYEAKKESGSDCVSWYMSGWHARCCGEVDGRISQRVIHDTHRKILWALPSYDVVQLGPRFVAQLAPSQPVPLPKP